jgi:L-asparaginase
MSTTLIATGGTIAWHSQQRRMLGAEDLLKAAGQAVDVLVDLKPVPSWDLSVEDMASIAARVRAAVRAGCDNVVVTHGTDTMEETAWLTELALGAELRRRATVLFTGAMHFADDPASDGPSNLALALQAAQDPMLVGLGVQVAWQGELYSARSVHKVDAAADEPFEGRQQTSPSLPLPEPGPALVAGVKLLKVGPVARPNVPEEVAGLVLEGTGAAHVPTRYQAIAERLIGVGVPVVFASRCRDVERNPDSSGPVLYAGDLTAEKAAIALMVALGRHRHLGELRAWWAKLVASGRPGG